MVKKDAPEADEKPVENEVEQVVLDKEPDVQGDLVPNPVIEEQDEPETDEGAAETPDEGEPSPEVQPKEKLEPDTAEPTEEPEETTPLVPEEKVEDPGDFKPRDHSFTITLDGTKHKVTSVEEADKLVDQIEDSKQLIRFMDKRSDMRAAIAQDRQQWQTQQEQFVSEQTEQKAREEQVGQWSNEIKYLESKGLVPKIDPKKDADWLGNKDDEAVADRLAIFNWMDTENKARQEAGIPEVTSAVDAFTMMKAETAQTTASEERSREGDSRRQRGSMISDNAPFDPATQPKNSIVGEGGSLKDLLHEAQLNL